MMKLVIFAVLGLCVGIGGGSAFAVMKAKTAHAAEVARTATTVADSLAKVQEVGDKHVASAGAPDSAGTAVDSSGAHAGGVSERNHAAADSPEHAVAKPGPAAVGTQTSAPTPSVASHDPPPVAPVTTSAKPGKSFDRALATVASNGTPTVAGSSFKPRPPALPAKPITIAPPAPGVTKVAKIFAAMPAKDAAKVLEQLGDNDIQSVLGGLNEKQAAAILQNFPTARAAAISKAALRSAMVKP